MDIFIHLKSDIPSTIYANGKFLGVASKRKSIDLRLDNKHIYFNVFQLGKYSPYTFELINNKELIDTTNCTLIVPYYNNNYDIYLSSYEIKENLPATTLINDNIGKYNISILNSINSLITIYNSNSIVFSENVELISKANYNIINGNLVIKAYMVNKKYYLLIINDNNEVVFNGYFDNLEENNNTLTCFTSLNDIAKHGQICEINLLDTNNIKEYYVIKDNSNICECNELIPMAFLESIKVKNFKLARTYLDDNLNKASNSHLEAYFGTIQAIYYNCYNNSSPLNYTIYNGNYEFYNFVIKNKKIVDIDKLK